MAFYVIHSDNRYRDFMCGSDLPRRVLQDYDWMDAPEDDCAFVSRKGDYYNVADFMRLPPDHELREFGWDGILGESYSSGMLIGLGDWRKGGDYKIGYFYVTDGAPAPKRNQKIVPIR